MSARLSYVGRRRLQADLRQLAEVRLIAKQPEETHRRTYLSKKPITVCQDGVCGAGFVTTHPVAVVDRIVAASRRASSVRKPTKGPCPALGMLMKTASAYALLSAMYSRSPWLCGTSGSEPPCRIISDGSPGVMYRAGSAARTFSGQD